MSLLTVRQCASSCPASTCLTRHRVRLPRGALAAGQERGEEPQATCCPTGGRGAVAGKTRLQMLRSLWSGDTFRRCACLPAPAGEAVSKHREAPPSHTSSCRRLNPIWPLKVPLLPPQMMHRVFSDLWALAGSHRGFHKRGGAAGGSPPPSTALVASVSRRSDF